MAYGIGMVLAMVVTWFGSLSGFDRDRAFYPILVITIASYYVLFAVMSGSSSALVVETAVLIVFVLAALAGFKSSLWFAAGALAGHGVYDVLHPLIAASDAVPAWWSSMCLAFDVCAAGILAGLLVCSEEGVTREQ